MSDSGYNSKLYWRALNSSDDWVQIPGVMKITPPSTENIFEEIGTVDSTSGSAEYEPTTATDHDRCTCELRYEGDNAIHQAASGSLEYARDNKTEMEWQITLNSGRTISWDGWVARFKIGDMDRKAKIKATLEIQPRTAPVLL